MSSVRIWFLQAALEHQADSLEEWAYSPHWENLNKEILEALEISRVARNVSRTLGYLLWLRRSLEEEEQLDATEGYQVGQQGRTGLRSRRLSREAAREAHLWPKCAGDLGPYKRANRRADRREARQALRQGREPRVCKGGWGF